MAGKQEHTVCSLQPFAQYRSECGEFLKPEPLPRTEKFQLKSEGNNNVKNNNRNVPNVLLTADLTSHLFFVLFFLIECLFSSSSCSPRNPFNPIFENWKKVAKQ